MLNICGRIAFVPIVVVVTAAVGWIFIWQSRHLASWQFRSLPTSCNSFRSESKCQFNWISSAFILRTHSFRSYNQQCVCARRRKEDRSSRKAINSLFGEIQRHPHKCSRASNCIHELHLCAGQASRNRNDLKIHERFYGYVYMWSQSCLAIK